MANIFHSTTQEKIDVGSIPNFDYLLKNLQSRKNYPIIFHIFYALICTMCIFVAVNGACANLSPIVSAVCMCLGPALLTYTFLYSPAWITISALAISAVSCFAVHLPLDIKTSFLHQSGHILMYLLVLCVAALLVKTSLSGYNKSTCFMVVTSVYVIMTLVSIAVLMVYYKGSLNPSVAVKSLDGIFDNFVNSVIKQISTQDNLSELRRMLPDAKSMTDDEIISVARTSLQQSVTLTKLILPVIVTFTCMFFSFVTVELFSVVAKKMKIDVFVCIMDKFWTFRPTRITAAFYDIIFFAYVISLFISFPPNISITIENLILILAPIMSVTGIQSIYRFFYRKNNKKGASVAICIVIVFAMLSFMGMLGIMFIGSLGVMYITLRDKEEWEVFTHSPITVENLEKKALYMAAVNENNNTCSDDSISK